jgi:hypothetical protein
MTAQKATEAGRRMQVTEAQTRTIDCAWCANQFDDVVALLEHVESDHLESDPLAAPEPDLDAAA